MMSEEFNEDLQEKYNKIKHKFSKQLVSQKTRAPRQSQHSVLDEVSSVHSLGAGETLVHFKTRAEQQMYNTRLSSETHSNQDICEVTKSPLKVARQFSKGTTMKDKSKVVKIPEFKARQPTLEEMFKLLREWYKKAVHQSGSLDLLEVEHTAIADFLVSKGLFAEKETGVKFILKSLKLKQDDNEPPIKICFDQFQRLFCRSIFKNCLNHVLREIEGADSGPHKKSLGQQISSYQRQLLLGGVSEAVNKRKPQTNPLKVLEPDQGGKVIEARRSQKMAIDPKYFEQKTYEEFFADPMGLESHR